MSLSEVFNILPNWQKIIFASTCKEFHSKHPGLEDITTCNQGNLERYSKYQWISDVCKLQLYSLIPNMRSKALKALIMGMIASGIRPIPGIFDGAKYGISITEDELGVIPDDWKIAICRLSAVVTKYLIKNRVIIHSKFYINKYIETHGYCTRIFLAFLKVHEKFTANEINVITGHLRSDNATLRIIAKSASKIKKVASIPNCDILHILGENFYHEVLGVCTNQPHVAFLFKYHLFKRLVTHLYDLCPFTLLSEIYHYDCPHPLPIDIFESFKNMYPDYPTDAIDPYKNNYVIYESFYWKEKIPWSELIMITETRSDVENIMKIIYKNNKNLNHLKYFVQCVGTLKKKYLYKYIAIDIVNSNIRNVDRMAEKFWFCIDYSYLAADLHDFIPSFKLIKDMRAKRQILNIIRDNKYLNSSQIKMLYQ